MIPWLVDLSQTHEAAPDVRRRLREIDSTAEVIYLGWGRFYVGKVRPTTQSVAIAHGMLASLAALPPRHRATARSIQRYRFALACQQGFRPVREYRGAELERCAVRDFEESRYAMLQAMHRDELSLAFDEAQAHQRADALAQLRDEARAREALKYGLTLSHSHLLRGENQRTSQPERSGWTRHTIPA